MSEDINGWTYYTGPLTDPEAVQHVWDRDLPEGKVASVYDDEVNTPFCQVYGSGGIMLEGAEVGGLKEANHWLRSIRRL